LSLMPDTARLFRALVHAAGTGSMAVVDGRHLRPSDESVDALRWLEGTPPDALVVPAASVVNGGVASFRSEGVFEVSGNRTERKVQKIQSDGVALPPTSGWEWRWNNVPEAIARVVLRLTEEVSCLGETESVV
ncbi:type I-U CRISPR-associated protein Cas5/Cas6, partial [Rhizobium leguminosarum]|nr:type I-U CRISPR-associated protein Cas5/Cas6 [Rhizobium leguminosarum]